MRSGIGGGGGRGGGGGGGRGAFALLDGVRRAISVTLPLVRLIVRLVLTPVVLERVAVLIELKTHPQLEVDIKGEHLVSMVGQLRRQPLIDRPKFVREVRLDPIRQALLQGVGEHATLHALQLGIDVIVGGEELVGLVRRPMLALLPVPIDRSHRRRRLGRLPGSQLACGLLLGGGLLCNSRLTIDGHPLRLEVAGELLDDALVGHRVRVRIPDVVRF